VLPSVESVRQGIYQPLSRPVFIYIAKKSLERPEVSAFVDFYLGNAERLVGTAGYVPLPAKAYVLGRERVAKRVVGTIFEGRGSEVGVPLEKFLGGSAAVTVPAAAPADQAAAMPDVQAAPAVQAAPEPAAPAAAQAAP
jgi:hypothetical protein